MKKDPFRRSKYLTVLISYDIVPLGYKTVRKMKIVKFVLYGTEFASVPLAEETAKETQQKLIEKGIDSSWLADAE
jgi:hypothetical protein